MRVYVGIGYDSTDHYWVNKLTFNGLIWQINEQNFQDLQPYTYAFMN